MVVVEFTVAYFLEYAVSYFAGMVVVEFTVVYFLEYVINSLCSSIHQIFIYSLEHISVLLRLYMHDY